MKIHKNHHIWLTIVCCGMLIGLLIVNALSAVGTPSPTQVPSMVPVAVTYTAITATASPLASIVAPRS